ncbi:DUF805 domain-containing protein [Auraticoccus monumenti]|uniref:Uncharacterized membrane protein YhaH, DUF805 family n=1 Tax=Auraticoccus monumenti TaxID=675864 RepID=A0A1G6XGD2_9ACTN|nr:DUF805 domain-containing protein [Auraticoccus monumenti]SDD76385.1 Uncharacterized membrane protein YhaH, DUF805 family [Auraticoccus monumenti]
MTGTPQDPPPSDPPRYEPYQPPAGSGPYDPRARPGWSPSPDGPSSSATPDPYGPSSGPSAYGAGPGQPAYGSNPYEQPGAGYGANPYEQAGAAYGYGTQPQQGPGFTGNPRMQPLYGAGFGQAVGRFFSKYAVFRGRASRSEYLWVVLFTTLVVGALYAVAIPLFSASEAGTSSTDVLTALWGLLFLVVVLAMIVPSIAVAVRRLHDAGYSGGMYCLTFIPYLGPLIVFILCCQPTSPNASRFDA